MQGAGASFQDFTQPDTSPGIPRKLLQHGPVNANHMIYPELKTKYLPSPVTKNVLDASDCKATGKKKTTEGHKGSKEQGNLNILK